MAAKKKAKKVKKTKKAKKSTAPKKAAKKAVAKKAAPVVSSPPAPLEDNVGFGDGGLDDEDLGDGLV